MARFRGTVWGGRGTASRLGHATQGLTTCAASFSGAVEVRLYHDASTGTDMAQVSLATHMGRGTNRLLYEGPVSG